MNPPLNSILIYARDMQRTAHFYQRYFGFTGNAEVVEGIIELGAPDGGASLWIHQAAKSVKLGQVGVKIVFAIQDIEGFKVRCAGLGLAFGSTHQANGYSFANAKDPDNNPVCISSRAFRATSSRHIGPP